MGSRIMRTLAVGTIVIVTALVTALVTSAFWLVAFNFGRGSDVEPPEKVITQTAQPDESPDLILAPSGLAVPVADIEVGDLVDTYRQSRSGGARVHNAIDIMAPEGRPVLAAADGTVEKLYFSRGGGGITVYVRSPDRRWIYYYAHLKEYAPGLEEGQRVTRGDRIGSVGSTGNASPAGPHLHFAVHRVEPDDPWYEGTPVNPYPLLAGPVEGS